MSRLALCVLAVGMLLLPACQNQKKKAPEPQPTAEVQPTTLDRLDQVPPEDPYLTAGGAPPPRTAPPPERQPTYATPQPAPADEELQPRRGGRTYVVKKGDTLSGIAKKMYGDPNKWRKIWEANKTRVPNKDRITPGTKLIIP